ncbi:uncharacterized protein LOC132612852 [Lycium barbarum]|uniref:uncharacterized protein LOC132612852 n=1 Tax=Lycium barbarum TaxID=112863 RepID=UPI00293F3CB7|nr:uncharacterized protein LOC132612852 [Lycium barbarum]
MDSRSWMYNRSYDDPLGIRDEFIAGVYAFVEYAKSLKDFTVHGVVRCPCVKCECMNYETPEIVTLHLYETGFKSNYTTWTSHRETHNNFGRSQNFEVGESNRGVERNVQNSRMHDMVQDAYDMHSDFEFGGHVEEPPNEEAKCFYAKLNQASLPLNDESPHSQLSVVVRLLNSKADNNISEGAMDSFIDLMYELVDPILEIPDNYYKAKILVSKLGHSSVRIDCCENGCMLYYKDDVGLESCKLCGSNRFKKTRSGKGIVVKAMHYLPLILRLKRLYASNSSAPHMGWHSENRRPPGVMCYPSDGEAWQNFDRTYLDFAVEPRNVRLGLCSDGFTPHSISAASYSCWPVFITPYNLPLEMRMTSPYIFLNCIIPGPRNPKVLIDVYLQPLVDELKQLWAVGVETYDILRKQNFNLRAALMWTINDFPAYRMLFGWMTAGKLACPHCMENTKSFTLKNG